MNSLKTISITLLATVLSATAAPRCALVRVKDIFTALPSTVAIQKQLEEEKATIMKDQRAVQLRTIIGQLQVLKAQLSDRNKPLEEATRRRLTRTYEITLQEANTLQKEFEEFKAEQEKIIMRKMVAGMRASLNRIEAVSKKISKERGYDLVFDSSGETNTTIPFVLFSKNAPDLTADIQAALKDSEAATPASKPEVTPPATKPDEPSR